MPFVTKSDYINQLAPSAAKPAAKPAGARPVTASQIAAQLRTQDASHRRSLLFAALARLGTAAAARAAARFLRAADPGLRNGAIEALQHMGECAIPVVDQLLVKAPPAVRLLAIEVTRAWPAPAAQPRLARLLQTDPHVNVCAAAADVAAETGTRALLAPLAALEERFPGQPFIAFAADIAIARIRAGGAPAA